MGAFNTDVAKYANNLFHSKNLVEILESAETNLEKGLITQDDKGNGILHYLSTKNALNAVEHLIDFLLLKYNDLIKNKKPKAALGIFTKVFIWSFFP